jgi:hypothetical protein
MLFGSILYGVVFDAILIAAATVVFQSAAISNRDGFEISTESSIRRL